MRKFWDENCEQLTYFFEVIGLFIAFVALGVGLYYWATILGWL
jgi:hypothetical protein